MNNDLISRSELKSVLKNECFWCANRDEPCNKSCWSCINEKIDNTPIVVAYSKEDMNNAWRNGRDAGYDFANFANKYL